MVDKSSKVLFENTYKSIRFTKSSNTNVETTESIADFYLNLPPEKGEPPASQHVKVTTPESNRLTSELPVISSKPTDLFKAVQDNDVNFLKLYIGKGFDPFVEDEFKWNVLMMAAASNSNHVLEYVLENVKDKDRLVTLLNGRDLSGNSVESLSRKFKNSRALELIEKFKSNIAKPEIKEEILSETVATVKYWCEQCKQEFHQSEAEHITSIIHQLNETQRPLSETSGRYHLRSDNRGYQLLVKSGWNEFSGLGVNEQGVKCPIKGKLKLNRKGLGTDKDDKKFQSTSLKSFKLQTSSSRMSRSTSLREFKRSERKSKLRERSLRRYFDS